MDQVLVCIGRFEHYQAFAVAADNDEQKAEYLLLAEMWLALASIRRKMLLELGSPGLH